MLKENENYTAQIPEARLARHEVKYLLQEFQMMNEQFLPEKETRNHVFLSRRLVLWQSIRVLRIRPLQELTSL